MLQEKKIEAAILAEKDASGFAELMRKFQLMGIQKYDYFVEEGCYRYYDLDSTVTLKLNAVSKEVATTLNKEALEVAIKLAQAGEIDFEKFCQLAGEAGISNWTSDLNDKKVYYRDNQANTVLSEPIKGIE